MVNIYNKDASEIIIKAAEELKKVEEIKAPEWAKYCKTGVSKERPPEDKDWWYKRTASMLRKLYLSKGPIGVSKLKRKYGGKKNRGHKPDRFYSGSSNITRKVLQQLEKAGFAKKAEVGVHKGRIITGKGKSFLDKLA
ncbi:MAG: 30S ribosomal protein S19e [Nanoarchaeota archaeon]|nr:30S ribosomal protein S19e [Nanoarchaeota archaeon]MBU0963140.1 30S ribosomal protein S19e [Nanoarchaeota archaeon]